MSGCLGEWQEPAGCQREDGRKGGGWSGVCSSSQGGGMVEVVGHIKSSVSHRVAK